MTDQTTNMSFKHLQSLPISETLDLGNGLSLIPRIKLLLTIFRSDPSPKPIDEWQLKISLLAFIKNPLSLSVSDEDLELQKLKDLKKRKREDPVASGTLYLRDLSSVKKSGGEEGGEIMDKRFLEWKRSVLDRMDGIELNLEGVKFRLSVDVPENDDYERLKKSWEDRHLENRGYHSGSGRYQPDTLVLEGVPSRWFAEPRVSSKASMLVTHTIFSVFGKIRNLNIGGADDLGKTTEEAVGGIISGLRCKIWVQFEKYDYFCNALKVLCGRSMQKQGSRLMANYEVNWDRDGFFRNMQQKTARDPNQGSASRIRGLPGYPKSEVPGHQSEVIPYGSNSTRLKRFRE